MQKLFYQPIKKHGSNIPFHKLHIKCSENSFKQVFPHLNNHVLNQNTAVHMFTLFSRFLPKERKYIQPYKKKLCDLLK